MNKPKKYLQYLKCTFTDAEIADRAKELAAANRKRASIEQQKKEIDSDLKSKIEAENSSIQRLSDQIAQGFEYRDIECRVELDMPTVGMKTIVRLDTGEEVKVTSMDDTDRQIALDLQADADAQQPEPLGIDAPDGQMHGEGFTAVEVLS